MATAQEIAIANDYAPESTEFFSRNENHVVWFDKYFLHTVEVYGEEVIYRTAPLVHDWQIEN